MKRMWWIYKYILYFACWLPLTSVRVANWKENPRLRRCSLSKRPLRGHISHRGAKVNRSRPVRQPTWKPALKMTLCSLSPVLEIVVKVIVLSFPLSVTAVWISLFFDNTLQRSKISLLKVPFKRRVAMNTYDGGRPSGNISLMERWSKII